MDAAEKILERYGTISISAPLLIPAPANQNPSPFQFSLPHITAKEQFEAARSERQSRQAIIDEAQLILAITGQAQFSPEEAIARSDASRGAAEADRLRDEALILKRAAIENRRNAAIAAIPAAATPEERQRLTDEASAKAREDEAALLLERAGTLSAPKPAEGFAPTLGTNLSTQAKTDGLSAAGSPKGKIENLGDTSIPMRSALVTAAGDTATQGMLSILGDPTQFLAGSGKQVLFGVAMVNVDPGWKTKEDFLAEVAVQVSYVTKANTISAPAADNQPFKTFGGISSPGASSGWLVRDDYSPLVVAVSPMTDIQATELDSGVRRRVELSLALAASLSKTGMKEQAAVFSSFARQLQSDINLTSFKSSVTSYSLSGGIFGFRVGPKMGAKIAPGGKQTKSRIVHELERVSFPVLVMVVLENSDIKKLHDGNTKVAIQFSQTNRWLTQTHWLGRLNWGFFRGRQDEKDIAECLYELDVNTTKLNGLLSAAGNVAGAETAKKLLLRARNISFLLGGSQHWQEIPAFVKNAAILPAAPPPCLQPVVKQSIPTGLVLNESKALESDVKLVILGADLKGDWTISWLNETKTAPVLTPSFEKQESGETALVITLPKGSQPTAGANALKLTRAKTPSCPEITAWTPPILVAAAPKKPDSVTPIADKTVTLIRTITTKEGETKDVYTAPVANADLLGRLVEREKPLAVATTP